LRGEELHFFFKFFQLLTSSLQSCFLIIKEVLPPSTLSVEALASACIDVMTAFDLWEQTALRRNHLLSQQHLSDSSRRLCRRTLMAKHFLALAGQDYINPRASCGWRGGDDNKHWGGSMTGSATLPLETYGDKTLILIC